MNTAHGQSGAGEVVVGIDLGTTNSLVAIADPSPRILCAADGARMLPSAVRYFEEQSGGADAGVREPVVGLAARDGAVEFPEWTVLSVKRLMGRSREDAATAGDLVFLGYRVVEGPNNTARVALPDGRVLSPQEVSATVLRRLKGIAESALGKPVRRAVVTVPAYFDDAQRQATRDAGRLAGLEVLRIVNEPTAAALAYGLGVLPSANSGAQNVVVYDLGGGTFDVSILRLTPGAAVGGGERDDAGKAAATDFFQVLSTAGDTHLGGDDFDHALVELFTKEIQTQFGAGEGGTSLEFPPETRQALRVLSERMKVRLSTEESGVVRIDLGEGERGGRVYERTVTRAEFEALIEPLVARSIECCKRALKDAQRALAGEAITAVILVGGSTRVPLVRARVEAFFQLRPYTALNPDEVVALGAAVQASVLAGNSRASLLLDVVPLSLGVETAEGAVAKLVMRNSNVPARATEMFSTSVDGQTSIKLNVLQGEREMAADCRSLGVFHLKGIPPMPAGIPQLQVEFLVDANGVLSVNAVEKRSGKRAELQIVPNHGLSQDEVNRIERESVTFAREDMTRHRVVDLIANARLDLKWIRKQFDRHRALLEPAYAAELEERIGTLENLTSAASADWRSVDPNVFHKAKEELDRASMRLHEVSITESLKSDAAPPASPSSSQRPQPPKSV